MNQITRTIFIASSSEDRGIAMMIATALLRYNSPELSFILQPIHWENVDWNLTHSPLQVLVQFPRKYDYGCFLFTPNDTVISRNITSFRVRDNVIFEFGLFVSQDDGIKKSFIIHPLDTNLKLAADLRGLITATYRHTDDKEALAVNIAYAAEKVFKAVERYEKEKIDKSEKAVRNSLESLREKLQRAREVQQPEIILNALKELAETKAQALNQSTTEVLKDILIWTNTILDITDADELAKLQNGDLRTVWVYSSIPIEFDSKLKELNQKFKDTVFQNTSNGVKYIYFLESEKYLEAIREIADGAPGKIEVCILDPICVTSNFVFHFYKDSTVSVYQNIVRRGSLESLVRLDPYDANILLKKVNSHFNRLHAVKEGNLTMWRKKETKKSLQ